MIFKSIDDTVNKVKNAIATINALKASASNESTFTFDEKFGTTLNKDVEALELYQKALRDEKSEVEAMATSFKEASASARTYAETHREINIEEFKNQQRAAQVETAAQNHTLANSKVIIDEYNAILTDSVHAQEANYQALSKTKLSQTEYLEAVGKSNPELKKYLSSLKQADGTTKGYVGSLILAKAATIGLKTVTLAFKTVINSIIGMGIGALVQLALSGIQKIIEAVKEAHKTAEEKLAEIDKRLSETGSTVKQIANDFRSLKQSADEVIPRFVELTAGVDEFGKKTKLTDKEYEEFISLNNKIAEMLPELNLGMDENGNAMLALSYSADTLRESLEALLEAQRQEANQKIAENMPELLEDVKKYEDATNESIKDIQTNISKINSGSFIRSTFGDAYSAIADAKSIEEFYDYVDYLTDKGIDVTKNVENVIGTSGMTYTATWDATATQAKNAVAGLEKEIDNLESKIKSKWRSINPSVSAWLQSDFLYNDMEEQMQGIAKTMVSALDFKNLNLVGKNGEETAKNVQSYITKYIINPLYSASPEVKSAFENLIASMQAGDISEEDFRKQMKSTFDSLINDMDESEVNNFKNTFVAGFNAMGVAGGDFSAVVDNLIDSWAKVPMSVDGATTSLSDLSDALQKLKSNYDIVATAEKEMADGGLTPSTIKSLADEEEHYLDYLYEENGIVKLNVEAWKEHSNLEMENNIKAIENEIEALEGEKRALDAAKVYADDYDGVVEEGAYRQSEYTKALTENGKALNDNKNKLALYSRAMQNATSDVKKATASISEIKKLIDILDAVQKNTSYSTVATYELIETYPELASAVEETVDGYTIEENAVKSLISEKAKEIAINESLIKSEARLKLIKSANNENTANTVDKIFDIYGGDIESFDDYIAAWEDYYHKSSDGTTWVNGLREYVDAYIDESKRVSAINKLLSELTNPDTYKSGRDADGKTSGDNETWFDTQYKLHKHLLEMEQESEEEYLSWLDGAYKQAHKEGILTTDEFYKY